MKKDTSGWPFPMEEYQARLKKVRKAMEERGVDVFMVNSPENIYYLTGYNTIGFYTFQALMIPKDEEPLMIVRQLETPNVWKQTWIERSIGYPDEEKPDRACQGNPN